MYVNLVKQYKLYDYTRLAYSFSQVVKEAKRVNASRMNLAGWILHFVQDDMYVASWYATYHCVLCCVLTS
jgi:hypothetical protein